MALGKALSSVLCEVRESLGAKPGDIPAEFRSRQVIVLCLGGLQVPGDSLGPRVGTYLKKSLPHQTVYGTISHSLDSRNLDQELERIKQKHPGTIWLAVDAAQGGRHSVGQVTVRRGPVLPGVGLGLVLPALGEISITGVVCPRTRRWWQRIYGGGRDPEQWAELLSLVIAEGIVQALGNGTISPT